MSNCTPFDGECPTCKRHMSLLGLHHSVYVWGCSCGAGVIDRGGASLRRVRSAALAAFVGLVVGATMALTLPLALLFVVALVIGFLGTLDERM